MKRLHSWMIGTHLFVGIGAAVGGIAPIINPSTPLGLSTEMLKKGPFSNYLIPGLFLMVVVGLGNLISALLISRDFRFRGLFSGMMGGILILWILIQCFILQEIGGLHIVFFLIGAAQGLMAIVLLYEQIFSRHPGKEVHSKKASDISL